MCVGTCLGERVCVCVRVGVKECECVCVCVCIVIPSRRLEMSSLGTLLIKTRKMRDLSEVSITNWTHSMRTLNLY